MPIKTCYHCGLPLLDLFSILCLVCRVELGGDEEEEEEEREDDWSPGPGSYDGWQDDRQ